MDVADMVQIDKALLILPFALNVGYLGHFNPSHFWSPVNTHGSVLWHVMVVEIHPITVFRYAVNFAINITACVWLGRARGRRRRRTERQWL